MKKRILLITTLLLMLGITFSSVFADDGVLVRKSISHTPGGEATVPGYLDEAEHAFIQMMKFYVPMQASDGEVFTEGLDYINFDGQIVENRDLAKPLVGVYMYGPSEGVEGVGFVGHGRRDAYAAVSLDDGLTWKKTNLSESADTSSSDVIREDVELFADLDYAYPGDVINMFHSVAGNKVLVAWPSRYCSSGQPNYALDTDEPTPEQEARRLAIADYLDIDLASASPEALYLIDMYGVGGQQLSVDYDNEKEFPQNRVVGEVPYSCLWTARGELVQGDDPRTTEVVEATYMRWFKAERLTSGRRDVFRVETMCVDGAGCAITWQEDPDGLRGGQGLGPGEGWSGATAHSQTDIWYSYIDWENFNVVQDPADETGATPMEFLAYEETAAGSDVTQKPKPFVPFAMPMRLTDNAKCNVANPQPYCVGEGNIEGLTDPPEFLPTDYGLKDMCADTVEIPTGPQDELSPICVTEDGLPLVGNTAATRPRLNLFGYASNPSKDPDNAFVVVVAEEDKGLGAFGFTDDQAIDAAPCDPEEDEGCIPFDSGKNMWYYSFSMSLGDEIQSARFEDELAPNLASHGNMLNQPEVDWETGEFYPVRNTLDMWDFGDYNYEIWNTEIARRGSLIAQDFKIILNDKSNKDGGLIAFPTWKQGIMNQGGPADVMARRILIGKNWNLNADGNPYAFRNIDCDEWIYEAGENPYYPGGLCKDSAINLSGTIPDVCYDSATGAEIPCPTVDLQSGTTFAIGDTNPVLRGKEIEEPNTTKVLSWHSCPAEFTTISATDGNLVYDCETDARTDDSTLADQSWYNPLDVSKGHRGFLDGDFVMLLYAWSPNWRLNTVGNDRYELYVRRSFDGGLTWTTTPGDLEGDGTTTCETFRSTETGGGNIEEPVACNEYVAGAAEQPRNVTQLKSMRFTTLDPRYAPTLGSITADPFGYGIPNYNIGEDEDLRDPSRYFIVFETGDNTTTPFGEAEPLDLFYSRAINYGDDYVVWAEEADLSVCYPSDPHAEDVPEELIGTGFCNEFDQMEQGIPGLEASEASLTANPGGQFLYGAWTQLLLDDVTHEPIDSDAMVRRVWWIYDYIPTNAWEFGGGSSAE